MRQGALTSSISTETRTGKHTHYEATLWNGKAPNSTYHVVIPIYETKVLLADANLHSMSECQVTEYGGNP